MGFTLQLLPDEPILITVAKGHLVVEDFAGMFAESRKLLAGMPAPIYRISDFREASSSFMELIRMAQIASRGDEGTTSDPRIKAILVGMNQWVNLARTIVEQPQYSAMRFPTFQTLDEALAYARAALATNSSKNVSSGV
ncbi:MAG: hypothetical protein LCI00_22570 [Chloroflexi bacterium]|nr:hypothetical protein [Chloroflexota bacterium]MCC6895252.1 hypothetical protein [Anaerolineae bacterium]